MSDLNTERSKSWTIYTASNPSQAAGEEAPWKSSFGTSSMSAVSFGFVATAILISMFLIMAIIEHFFKLTPQFSSAESMPESSTSRPHHHREPARTAKHANPQTVASSSPSYACDMSVLMPGQQYPSYIAQPAPLPCPREGTYSHSRHHI